MRITRLLTILGPASVLYVLAARVSSNTAASPDWLVSSLSLALSLTPLAVAGARPSKRGASRLAIMGVSLAVAIASARAGSPPFERTHDIAWLIGAVVMLDLALPREVRGLVRAGILGGLVSAALVGVALGREGLIPEWTLGVLVVAAIFGAAALHQIVLVERGHVIEGTLSGLALVGLGVGVAYSWLGPLSGSLASIVEFGVAWLLWLGHLAWIEPRWRSLRRIGIPVVAACAACFVGALAFVGSAPLEGWRIGLLAVASGLAWWMIFSLARRLSQRAVWSASGRLADGAEAASLNLTPGATLEEIATGTLLPLTQAFGAQNGLPELYTLEPGLRIRLDSGERPSIKPAEPPDAILRAHFIDGHRGVLDLFSLRTRVVREPSVRKLVDTMEHRAIGCVLPCVHLDHTEGLLLLPLQGRSEAFSSIELGELARLGSSLGGALASALAQRRADVQIQHLSTSRREADDRITALERELEQLREQCDLLGRGVAEDQTLHVAYSASMRRVQTRAIEVAPIADPILLVASAGSPVLPVSRFIHDRGPRWEAPFVVANCSTAPPDQVTSLLFGSPGEGRTGLFQSAEGGTLLLRDIAALSKPAQAKLAVALSSNTADDGEADRCASPRIIATSRAPLSELVRRGAIDPELAMHFSRQSLTIPPLRDRREDVPSLALLAIDRACRVLAREPVGIDQDAMRALVDHDWPGDVAELELVIELAVARASSKTVALADLPPLAWPGTGEDESLDGTYLEVERRLLERALLRSGGNKSEAARMLGLKRTTFLDKLRRHGLEQRAHHDIGGSAVG